jgi:hypothetical protein
MANVPHLASLQLLGFAYAARCCGGALLHARCRRLRLTRVGSPFRTANSISQRRTPMSFSIRSSSRSSARMALRCRRSAAKSRAIRMLRRTSLRSHFVVARMAARVQAAMARLRSIEASRWSSKDEIGGLELSFTVMVSSSTARWLRRCVAARGLYATARSRGVRTPSPERTGRLEGTLRSSGSFSGDFLQMLENHAKSGSSLSPHSGARVAPRSRHIAHQ